MTVSYDPQEPARPVNYVAGGQVPAPPPQSPVPYPYYAPPLVRPTSGLATASMILGLVGLIPCFFGVPSLVGLTLGHMALKDTKAGIRGGHGQAVTGLILGYAVVGLGVLYLALMLLGYGFSLTQHSSS